MKYEEISILRLTHTLSSYKFNLREMLSETFKWAMMIQISSNEVFHRDITTKELSYLVNIKRYENDAC